jgi:hypothetical protein
VSDDDHVDLMLTWNLFWVYRNDDDDDDHYHFHCFLKETVLVFYKHLFSSWRMQSVMVFYHYV